MKILERVMLVVSTGLPLAACASSPYPAANPNDPNSTTILTPSGRTVQAPPVAMRSGDRGGESGGSGRN